jgi:hypothetical protein
METRIIYIARQLNITVERALEFLISSGYDIVNNPYTKISEVQKQSLLIEFQDDEKIKSIVNNKKIEDKEKLDISNEYKHYKEMYYQQFQSFSSKRNKLLDEINILTNLQFKEKEFDQIILRKKNEIDELMTEYEIAIQQFEPNLLYGDDYDENSLNDDYEDDYEDEIEVNNNDDSNYNQAEWSHYTADNPWRDVFGDGDEAETAYWNTD